MAFEVSREQLDSREVWPAGNLSLLALSAACGTLSTTRQLGLGTTFHRKEPHSQYELSRRKPLVKNCGLFPCWPRMGRRPSNNFQDSARGLS